MDALELRSYTSSCLSKQLGILALAVFIAIAIAYSSFFISRQSPNPAVWKRCTSISTFDEIYDRSVMFKSLLLVCSLYDHRLTTRTCYYVSEEVSQGMLEAEGSGINATRHSYGFPLPCVYYYDWPLAVRYEVPFLARSSWDVLGRSYYKALSVPCIGIIIPFGFHVIPSIINILSFFVLVNLLIYIIKKHLRCLRTNECSQCRYSKIGLNTRTCPECGFADNHH